MKKEFERPELIIILFTNDDIIAESGLAGDSNGEEGYTSWPIGGGQNP